MSVDCEVPLLLKNIIDVNHNKNNFGSIAVEILQNSNLQKNNFISYARNINIFFMHDKIKHFEHFQNNCKLYHKWYLLNLEEKTKIGNNTTIKNYKIKLKDQYTKT